MKRFVIFCSVVFGSLLVGSSVFAMTVISPVLEIGSEAGSTQDGVLKLYNETDRTITLQASIEEFDAADEFGTAQSLGASADFLDWFDLNFNIVTLQPQQVGLIPFTITVPATATPGGYYAMVAWQQQTVEGEPQVAVQGRVATLILLTVDGELTYDMQLDSFDVAHPTTQLQEIFPQRFSIKVTNAGNIHTQPTGSVTISNWQGEVTTLPVNTAQRAVLPGAQRHFQVEWGSGGATSAWRDFLQQLQQEVAFLPFGQHTATLQLSYNAGGEALTATTTFWLMPWRLISVVGGIVFFLFMFIFINSRVARIRRTHVKVN